MYFPMTPENTCLLSQVNMGEEYNLVITEKADLRVMSVNPSEKPRKEALLSYT